MKEKIKTFRNNNNRGKIKKEENRNNLNIEFSPSIIRDNNFKIISRLVEIIDLPGCDDNYQKD